MNLVGAVAIAGTIAFVGARNFVPAGGARWIEPTSGSRAVYSSPSPIESPVNPHVSPPPGAPTVARRHEYAFATHELRGLSPDAQPGATLDLWVAWDASYVKEPQVQRLLKGAVLSRFIEPVTPSGPVVAVLTVPAAKIGDLMYGDLYGQISVTMPRS